MSLDIRSDSADHRYGLVVLQDERLMHRIDAYAHQQYDTEHPLDACPKCGTIQPGYRYCRDDMTRIPRKRGVDKGFWVQEVAGEAHHQDAFARIVGPALNADGEGVHLWVTAALKPESETGGGVQVVVISGGPAEHVGHIPESDAVDIRKACRQVARACGRTVACRALINGGFALDDGTTATYGISLLLPPAAKILAFAEQTIASETPAPASTSDPA